MCGTNLQSEKKETKQQVVTGPVHSNGVLRGVIQPPPPPPLPPANAIPPVPGTKRITRSKDTVRRQSETQDRQTMEAQERVLVDDTSEMLESSASPAASVSRNKDVVHPRVKKWDRREAQDQQTTEPKKLLRGKDYTYDMASISKSHGTIAAGSVFHRGDNRSYEELERAGGFIPDKYKYKPEGEDEDVECDEIESARRRVRDIYEKWDPEEFVQVWKYPGSQSSMPTELVRADITGYPKEGEQGRTRAGVATSVSDMEQAGNNTYEFQIPMNLSVIKRIESPFGIITFYGDGESEDDSTVLAMNLQRLSDASELVFLTPVFMAWIIREKEEKNNPPKDT